VEFIKAGSAWILGRTCLRSTFTNNPYVGHDGHIFT
jgi:hypothetical protein